MNALTTFKATIAGIFMGIALIAGIIVPPILFGMGVWALVGMFLS
jgi:hypothetical protein